MYGNLELKVLSEGDLPKNGEDKIDCGEDGNKPGDP